jgi:hypothetical protein
MERDSIRGCYSGERAGVATPCLVLLEDKQFQRREDCNVPFKIGALERRLNGINHPVRL